MRTQWVSTILVLLCVFSWSLGSLQADGPSDNRAENVRPIPPPGIAIPDDRRESLLTGLGTLNEKIQSLYGMKDELVQKYLPDVEIFHRALSLALHEDGFFEVADFDRADAVLREGIARADALAGRSTPWRQVGRRFATVRGFRSKLDGTVQPYGVVMNNYPPDGSKRADVWCRGRSEKGLELQFLAARLTQFDPLPESGVLMIHPFGRYCNANKLAGEVDTLEAIEHAMSEYAIDPRRVSIRGFSMGGAAAWHLAVHYPDRWFAANPGAGFSETPDFLKVFQSETLKPYWFEQKLWQMYDAPVWVRNLRMLPTIAYSGALDKQKQAADIMAKAAWELPVHERFELTHIIAPNTGHQVAPEARKEIEKRLKALDRLGSELVPSAYSFTTCTLRYAKAHQLTMDRLTEHWRPTTVHVVNGEKSIQVTVDPGLQQFSLEYAIGEIPKDRDRVDLTIINRFEGPLKFVPIPFSLSLRSDRSLAATFRRKGDTWEQVSPIEPQPTGLYKRHALQGPIDDAFMDGFLFVRPVADGLHPETQRWVQSELDRAVREWHRQMRGDVRIKNPEDVTPEDLRKYHLILWGDPQSNPLIAQVLPKLPMQWNAETLELAGAKWNSPTHMPVMIYPNPLSTDRYVVLNSSFTYREYDYLNNARQVPKLPDWAVIDISVPPDARWPGRIADADFFDELWQFKPDRPSKP
ncbi:MAG: prolyl oligopeptidase family serine peptidase [Pirellula sp.]|nr:prolyl oligopeptidase family serine peptidase [Pirellula sp.]